MAYKYLIEFTIEPEFGSIKEVRNFSDALRDFLRNFKIKKYDHVMDAEHTYKAIYTFTRSFDSLEESRDYLDKVRMFLTERGYKKHSYHIIAERE
jgi:hypothetical protein